MLNISYSNMRYVVWSQQLAATRHKRGVVRKKYMYGTELCNRQIQYEDCWLVVVLCDFFVTWMYHGGGLISNRTAAVCVAGLVTLFNIKVCLLHAFLGW